MGDVAQYLNAAIRSALVQMPERHERWVRISYLLGRFRMPSLLAVDIQRLGRLDVVLCNLENDQKISGNEEFLLVFDFISDFSNVWVRSAYSTLFAIPKEMQSEEIKKLFYDLDRLRLTIEKYEIPKDRDIPKGADGSKKLELYTSDGMTSRNYDVADPSRAIIPPSGIADDGSICWQIIDVLRSQSRWLSRRSLADRYLALAEQSASGATAAG
jgi:hypothetical protein